jgi:hypothetical protein
MAPELLRSQDAAALKDCAARIQEWQQVKALSDSALLRKFDGLGSTTTYKRILKGDIAELDLEKQLINYRSVVALIEAMGEEEDAEELYEDFLGALELKRAFFETNKTNSIARFILIDGDTGTGKTSCLKLLVKKYGTRFLFIEATDVWGDRPRALLCAILLALGASDLPESEYDCLLKAVEMLNRTRKGILLDEGHHMGPRCLNTLKTIINQTPGEVIAAAMPTLWRRVERAAYEESRQLTGNRLAERIVLNLVENDVLGFLERRLQGMPRADLKRAVEQLMKEAPLQGNHGFVREVCKRTLEATDKGESPTWETFLTGLAAQKQKRGRK